MLKNNETLTLSSRKKDLSALEKINILLETCASAQKIIDSVTTPKGGYKTVEEKLQAASDVFIQEEKTLKKKSGGGTLIGRTTGQELVKTYKNLFKEAKELGFTSSVEHKIAPK